MGRSRDEGRVKVAASLVVLGLIAAAVVEWQGWPREAGLFAAVTGAALGGLIALQVAIARRLDALEDRVKRPRRDDATDRAGPLR